MHVLIVNSVSLNGGDAAILTSIVALVRNRWGAHTEITVMDSHAEQAARHLPHLRFVQTLTLKGDQALPKQESWLERKTRGLPRIAQLAAAAALLAAGAGRAARRLCSPAEYERLLCFKQADLVISTGGTYIVPHYDVRDKLLSLALAFASRTPYVLYTQSIGKFGKSKRATLVAASLRQAAFVLLRDEASLRNVLALGAPPSRCRVVPDVVFSMAKDELLAPRPPLADKTSLRIIVSVRDWPHFVNDAPETGMARYKQAVATVLTELVQTRGASITFLSTCQGIPQYAYDDSVVARQIAELMPAPERESVTVNGSHLTAEQLQQELAQADVLIGTRMHMAILGLSAGTPVLPIAYEFKTQELFEQLGFADWVQSIDEVTTESLRACVQRVLTEADPRRTELMNAVRAAKDAATRSIDLIPSLAQHGNLGERSVGPAVVNAG